MLEILAGRLLAPYVGVSLETFTGIIGVVLAGIAVGAWLGGSLADQRDPAALIGPALVVGGGLTILVLPILDALGGQFGDGNLAIVLLSLFALFAPAAVLTAISPMVAKMRLGDLDQTGAVVGGLSAAGTIGALAGTFLTGFVLVAALPTRPTVILIGVVLIASGALFHLRLAKSMPTAGAVVFVIASLALGITSNQPCDYESGYFCGIVLTDEDNANGRSLYLDGLRHAYVDLNDPTNLDIRYIRLFADVAGAMPAGPIDGLHIGGGGFSFPRYLNHVRPGSQALVLEIDGALVDLAEDELGLEQTDDLQITIGDARLALADLDQARFDLVIGDAFSSRSAPWHLTTVEFLQSVDRVLAPNGIYAMNVIDGGDLDFARSEVATLLEVFDNVQVIEPAENAQALSNYVLVASQTDLPPLVIDRADGRTLPPAMVEQFVDGASVLTDDFAPVDQLLG